MRLIFGAVLAAATAALDVPLALNGLWAWALVITALGLLWWLEAKNEGDLVSALGLVLYIGMSAFGLIAGLQREAMLLAAVLSLAAWDLDHFVKRLLRADQVENERVLLSEHLQRLALVVVISLGLGWMALSVRLDLSFWWIFLIALLGVAALSKVLGGLQQEDN